MALHTVLRCVCCTTHKLCFCGCVCLSSPSVSHDLMTCPICHHSLSTVSMNPPFGVRVAVQTQGRGCLGSSRACAKDTRATPPPLPSRFRIRQRCHALHFSWDFIDLHTRLREASNVLLSPGHHAQNIRIYRPWRSPRARFALRSSADPLAPTPSELARPFRTTSRVDAFADDPAPTPRLAATTTTLAASE